MNKLRINSAIIVSFGLISGLYLFPGPLFASSGASKRDSAIELALEKAAAQPRPKQALIGKETKETPAKTIQEDDFKKLSGGKLFELGYELSSIAYEEPDMMRETGIMSGVSGSFTYYGWMPLVPFNFFGWLPNLPEDRSKCKNMFKVEGKLSSGQVDYRNSGSIDDIRDFMAEIRALMGPVFYGKEIAAIPYLGYGYRYLNDDMGGKISSTGAYGYERESTYNYIPLGANLIFALNHGWFIETNSEFDFFMGGKQISRLSDVDPGYNDAFNEQSGGYGMRGSIRLKRAFKAVDFIIEPFVKFWSIKRSDDYIINYNGVPAFYAYEPKNHSTECGLKVATRF